MKKLRCAIYTRISTEDGLEQEFNSLDRPALQRLLKEVQKRQIDQIVVY